MLTHDAGTMTSVAYNVMMQDASVRMDWGTRQWGAMMPTVTPLFSPQRVPLKIRHRTRHKNARFSS